jgi:hypothetical protein
MSYATQRDALVRTQQDLVTIAVRECQNHYAALLPQLLTYTDDFSNAAWTATSVTVAADGATAPDGTTTADTVSFSATGDAIEQETADDLAASTAFTGSVCLRVATGTNTVTLKILDDTDSESNTEQVTVTTTWQRFYVHCLFTGSATGAPTFQIIRTAGDDIGDVEVWRANLHANPANEDEVVRFPSVERVAEDAATVSGSVSRCNISDQGDGARCFYSRPTCQYPDGFNAGNTWEETPELQGLREIHFCRRDRPLAVPGMQILPLVTRIPVAAQEIDVEHAVTVNDRSSFEFEDDASPGVWNPRQKSRGALVNTATGQGTFWRRFRVIYRNYSNPEGYLTRRRGFVEAGVAESDYQDRGKFLIRDVRTRNRICVIECTNRLQLTRKSIPAEISDTNTLTGGAKAADTTLLVGDASEITEPPTDGSFTVTLELDPDGTSEKVNVTARDLDSNTLTVQRGRWGTSARKHSGGTAFREVAEFGTEAADPTDTPLGKNPIDIDIELYRYAGLTASEVDSATLESERDLWLPSDTSVPYGPLLRRSVTEQVDVEQLAQEIRELTMLMLWTNDSQQLTGKVFAPNPPGQTITDLTDEANFVQDSIEVDDDDETRLSRVLIAYSLPAGESGDSPGDYEKIRAELDIDSEERELYGDKRLKAILSQWIPADDTFSAAYFTAHWLWLYRNGQRRIRARLEIKDEDIQLGQIVRVTTALLQDAHGSDAPTLCYAVLKRASEDNTFSIEMLDASLPNRIGFYAPNGLSDYTSASADDKEYGYYGDDNGFVGSPLEPGYHYW